MSSDTLFLFSYWLADRFSNLSRSRVWHDKPLVNGDGLDDHGGKIVHGSSSYWFVSQYTAMHGLLNVVCSIIVEGEIYKLLLYWVVLHSFGFVALTFILIFLLCIFPRLLCKIFVHVYIQKILLPCFDVSEI